MLMVSFFQKLKAIGQITVDKIVGIAVALLVVAIIFPIAIDELLKITGAGWNPALLTLLQVLLPVLAVIGVILAITRQK